jgi:hypothetical protein
MKGTTDLPTQSSIANVINSVSNQTDSSGASSRVMNAIQSAANKTGVDFSYLLQKASQESGFDPSAKASTSSATGLFQFTKQTWLQMVKNSGAQYGLGGYASQITSDSNGHLSVKDPATRQAILDLRKDPQISAEMAGELDKQNATSLKQNVGGKIGKTELYLAHFLGAGGASNFIEEMRSNPNATAATVLPDAAASNPSVFYNASGEPRTLGQIYQHFAQKFDAGSATTQMASASPISSHKSIPTSSSSINSSSINLSNIYAQASLSPNTSTPLSSFRTASAQNIATSTSSTLFTAMLMGQMNDTQTQSSSALSAINQSNEKKKDAMAALSSLA